MTGTVIENDWQSADCFFKWTWTNDRVREHTRKRLIRSKWPRDEHSNRTRNNRNTERVSSIVSFLRYFIRKRSELANCRDENKLGIYFSIYVRICRERKRERKRELFYHFQLITLIKRYAKARITWALL